MLRFVEKHPIWFALLLLVVGPASLNISGFCWSKPGWLSDEEQIRLAVEAIALSHPNHNYLDMYFEEKMGTDAFYKSFHIPGKEHGSYETLYSTYYDPRLWKGSPDKGYSSIGHENKAKIIEEFMKENPDCCKTVGRKGKPFVFPSFEARMLGGYADVIEVSYIAPFIENKTGKLVYLKGYTEYPVIENCGKVHKTPAI